MAQILRQSTQIIVRIGPAVAVGDGFTPVTTLDLSAADEAELLKANTTTTTSIAAATLAAITGCDGWYGLTLTTTLTDTVGPLDIMINDDSLILPIFARFQVVEEAVYDRDYAASATGIVGTAQTWDSFARIGATGSGLTSLASQSSVDTIDGIVDAILVDTGTTLDARLPAALVGGRMASDAIAISGSTLAADNAEVVYANDFAVNYNITFAVWNTNVERINDVEIVGDGAGTPFNVA